MPLTSTLLTLLTVGVVVANEGQRIDIPDGCILENSKPARLPFKSVLSHSAGLLSGNLNMIVSGSPLVHGFFIKLPC